MPTGAYHALRFVGFNADAKRSADVLRERHTVEAIFQEIFVSAAFRRAYVETQIYRRSLLRSWQQHETTAAHFMSQTLGVEDDRCLSVVVVHPHLLIGSYLGSNEIEWGYPELYKNYQVVGLVHEMLHAVTEKIAIKATEEDKWRLHAIIYLAANEEFRMIISPYSGGYFPRRIVKHYDRRLIAHARRLLPQWKAQVATRRKGMVELFDEVTRRQQISVARSRTPSLPPTVRALRQRN
jgi:hypothetical protein